MPRGIQLKAALIALLVGAAIVGHQTRNSVPAVDPFILGLLLLFGIVNVLLSAPGTQWVRGIAIGTASAALLGPYQYLSIAAVLAWLTWPPAFMVAWAFARHSGGSVSSEGQEGDEAATRARIALAALIGAVALASVAYRLLFTRELQQTAALFVGIPALLAIVVVFAVSPRSATGVACKAVTLGLLVSLLFLGEGFLCVAMSAPIFYLIAIAIATIADRAHRRNEKRATTLFSCVLLLATVPMSLEGVTDFTTLNRDESVAASKIVRGSPQAVAHAMFEPPRFDRVRPFYLRAGFPSPVSTRIERESDETRWVIQVRGGEMRLDGMEPRTGDLVLKLEESRPGLVRWRAVSDSSHMTHFLTWREIIVRWEAVDADTTSVTWTLRYRRGLDPAWYFGPMERYAARLAAGYLIDSVATP
jgi:hypothetical protein